LGIVFNPKKSFTFKVIITIIEAFGIILIPIYLLSMLRQMFYGYKLSEFVTSSKTNANNVMPMNCRPYIQKNWNIDL
jgi:NAD(P)H-quinone oxidoreductase subunit 4